MYVEFIKNFFLADSRQLMGVRVISASWAQKLFIHTFLTRCTSSSWKVFFSPIWANWWVLESFRPPEPKNVRFPLSRHDVRWVQKKIFSRWFARTNLCYSHFGLLSPKTFDSHFLDMMYVEFMKNFFSLIRSNWWVLESFRPPEPKNVWFPLSRHDVRKVHKKIFFRWFARTDEC